MTSYRKERVGDMLLGFLGQELRKLGDPRLEFITLTDIEMSPDLKLAKVYWTIHARSVPSKAGEAPPITPKEDIDTGERALKGILPLLRRRMADELDLRYLPELSFRFDESIDRGMRIDYLLDKVNQ